MNFTEEDGRIWEETEQEVCKDTDEKAWLSHGSFKVEMS